MDTVSINDRKYQDFYGKISSICVPFHCHWKGTQVDEIFPNGGQGPLHPAESTSWQLITQESKEPRQQQPWYQPRCNFQKRWCLCHWPTISRFQHQKGWVIFKQLPYMYTQNYHQLYFTLPHNIFCFFADTSSWTLTPLQKSCTHWRSRWLRIWTSFDHASSDGRWRSADHVTLSIASLGNFLLSYGKNILEMRGNISRSYSPWM